MNAHCARDCSAGTDGKILFAEPKAKPKGSKKIEAKSPAGAQKNKKRYLLIYL